MASEQSDYCEHAGHEWVDAGGGLQMCMVCEAERWSEVEHLEAVKRGDAPLPSSLSQWEEWHGRA